MLYILTCEVVRFANWWIILKIFDRMSFGKYIKKEWFNYEFNFKEIEDLRISHEYGINIFRIMQELLQW